MADENDEIDEDGIKKQWEQVGSKLDERGRRLWAASEVQAAGHGALKVVSRITGLARSTINRGEDDLDAGPLPGGRVRRKGGGGRPLSESDPTLVDDLRRLVEPATLGSPVQPLRWVSKSREKLARALGEMGHKISANTVGKLLTDVLGFSRQVNRKADEGSHHPDRNAQFEHINAKVVAAQAKGEPVISVDTKKKELVGNYRNAGSDYRPQGQPARVNVHDFADKELGEAVPYGVYDVAANEDFVSVCISADTAEFAVAAIRTWLERMGRQRYPKMSALTITADIEPAKAGVALGMQPAGEAGELGATVRALTFGRVAIEHGWRCGAAMRALIAHVNPLPAGPAPGASTGTGVSHGSLVRPSRGERSARPAA